MGIRITKFFRQSQSAIALMMAAGLVSGAAQATVMSGDDVAFGVGSLTIDTVQGLEFLDLTQSTNRSVNDVSAQFGAGGGFAGFRYATRAEVVALVNNYGFSPTVTIGSLNTGVDQLSGLVALLGITHSNSIYNFTIGFTSDVNASLDHYLVWLAGGLESIGFQDLVDVRDGSAFAPSLTDSRYGSWLVRAQQSPQPSPAPEPTSVALLALGLAGLGFSRRKRAS